MTAVPYEIFIAVCVCVCVCGHNIRASSYKGKCSQVDLLFLKNICKTNGLTPTMQQNQA